MRMNTDWVDVSQGKDVPRVTPDLQRLQVPTSPQVTWLGHSCFLIQYAGFNILTDPVFSQRASPISFAGPLRYTQPPLDLSELPTIHAVVISHNHYDHLDLDTIETIDQQHQPHWFVPLKNEMLLEGVDVHSTRIDSLDWWSTGSFQSSNGKVAQFTATPAQHWSARGLFDRNEMLWASWVIDLDGRRIFFGGDTGYQNKIFRDIGARYGPFELGLIPIGAYAPREFMHPSHVNPFEAVQIHLDIKAKQSFGAHWGTFPLTAEPVLEPLKKLQTALDKFELSQQVFRGLALGETVSW